MVFQASLFFLMQYCFKVNFPARPHLSIPALDAMTLLSSREARDVSEEATKSSDARGFRSPMAVGFRFTFGFGVNLCSRI